MSKEDSHDWEINTILQTKPDDSPLKEHPVTTFYCKVADNDHQGHIKVEWLGEHEELLEFHFDRKWINASHFILADTDELFGIKKET